MRGRMRRYRRLRRRCGSGRDHLRREASFHPLIPRARDTSYLAREAGAKDDLPEAFGFTVFTGGLGLLRFTCAIGGRLQGLEHFLAPVPAEVTAQRARLATRVADINKGGCPFEESGERVLSITPQSLEGVCSDRFHVERAQAL